MAEDDRARAEEFKDRPWMDDRVGSAYALASGLVVTPASAGSLMTIQGPEDSGTVPAFLLGVATFGGGLWRTVSLTMDGPPRGRIGLGAVVGAGLRG